MERYNPCCPLPGGLAPYSRFVYGPVQELVSGTLTIDERHRCERNSAYRWRRAAAGDGARARGLSDLTCGGLPEHRHLRPDARAGAADLPARHDGHGTWRRGRRAGTGRAGDADPAEFSE